MPSLTLKPSSFRIWDRLHIELSATEITVQESSGIISRVLTVLHKQPLQAGDLDSEELLAAQLHTAIRAAGRLNRCTTITLADALLRMWIVTPPGNATSMADCKGAAALRFHGLYGEFAGDWEMVADWDARRPFLASALRRSLLQRLLAVCAEFKLTVTRIDPHFVAIWNRHRHALSKNAWLGIVDNESLTLAALDAGRLVALRSTSVTCDVLHIRTWLDQHLQREALLLNLTLPKQLQISGTIPPQWLKHSADQIPCLPLGPLRSRSHRPVEELQKGAA